MSCRRTEFLLPAAVDDRLDSAQRDELSRHLAGCEACAAALAAMRDARAALVGCGPAEPPADLAERISRSVRAATGADATPSFWDRFVPIAWPTALAASIAAAVLVVMMLRGGDNTPARAGRQRVTDPVEQAANTSTDNDEQLALNVLGMEPN